MASQTTAQDTINVLSASYICRANERMPNPGLVHDWALARVLVIASKFRCKIPVIRQGRRPAGMQAGGVAVPVFSFACSTRHENNTRRLPASSPVTICAVLIAVLHLLIAVSIHVCAFISPPPPPSCTFFASFLSFFGKLEFLSSLVIDFPMPPPRSMQSCVRTLFFLYGESWTKRFGESVARDLVGAT